MIIASNDAQIHEDIMFRDGGYQYRLLDGGRIIEDGTYDELISKNGYFAELVERQRVDN